MNKFSNLIKKKNIPNIITVSRMVWVIPIAVMFGLSSRTPNLYNTQILSDLSVPTGPDIFLLLAGIFFIFASLGDYLDGYLARKYHWVSEFGKLWDPIADKILVNTAMIGFVWQQYLPFWALLLSSFRDICVEGFRQHGLIKKIDISAQKIGKWKTTVQMVALSIIFFAFNFPLNKINGVNDQITFWIFQNGLIIISLIISIISGFLYLFRFYRN